MQEVIKQKNIAVNLMAETWQQAITEAGKLLVSSGDISDEYIASMIESVETLGPYIVLMPGFALAHAAPSSAVKKDGMSLITLNKPVEFGSPNDPVDVVLCLACVDKTSHMEKLKIVAEKLMNEGIVEKMKGCKTALELYELMNA